MTQQTLHVHSPQEQSVEIAGNCSIRTRFLRLLRLFSLLTPSASTTNLLENMLIYILLDSQIYSMNLLPFRQTPADTRLRRWREAEQSLLQLHCWKARRWRCNDLLVACLVVMIRIMMIMKRNIEGVMMEMSMMLIMTRMFVLLYNACVVFKDSSCLCT